MALTTATIGFDLANWFGDDFDARRTKGWITTNVDRGFVTDTEANKIRVDDAPVVINADGTGTATVWTPGPDANPSSWQTTFHFDVPRNGRRDRKVISLGPFTITSSADLVDYDEEQAVPPTYMTLATAQLDAHEADLEDDLTAHAASLEPALDAKVVEAEGHADDAATSASAANASAGDAADSAASASEIALGDADAALAGAVNNPASATSGALEAAYVAQRPYTIAVIPDTQYLSESWPAHYQALADYLTANAEALNLQLILHVGDHVNIADTTQYAAGDPMVDDLFAIGVPVIYAIGNHDYDDNVVDRVNNTTLWNTYIPPSRYTAESWFDGDFYDPARSDNMYLTTTLGGRPTLVFSLEFGPRAIVMDWADTVVAAHPNHDVIVDTHSYLNIYGERVLPGEFTAPGSPGLVGSAMWDQYMRYWPNLVGVFNGHHIYGDIASRVDLGDEGNAAFQQVANWQETTEGGQGRVTLFTVNPVNRTARRQVYNSALDAFDTTDGYDTTIRLGETVPKAATDALYGNAAVKDGLTLGTARATVRTLDAADLDIDDLDIRARLTSETWTFPNVAGTFIVGKWDSGTTKQYALTINSSKQIGLLHSTNGSSTASSYTSTAVPFTAGDTGWIRAVRNSGTGVVSFYTSTDYEPGVNTGTWVPCGTAAGTSGALYAGTSEVIVGDLIYSAGWNYTETIHDAEIWDSTTLVAAVRFGPKFTTYTDTEDHLWTIDGSGYSWRDAVRPVELAQRSQPTPWTALPLAAGHETHSAAVGYPPQYRLIGDTVELRGTFKRTASATFVASSSTTIATLPTGFRPPTDGSLTAPIVYFAAMGSSGFAVRIEVYADGSVKYWTSAAATWAPLDGVRFSTTR